MLKLPKGLKKKKKKSKKDQDLFTEEELEEYKRQLKAKQEVASVSGVSTKSDAGESDVASEADSHSSAVVVVATSGHPGQGHVHESSANRGQVQGSGGVAEAGQTHEEKEEEEDEWAKFKALTSGVDTILHKTQDELDRIKKESFYQRVPTAVEKKRLEEEEAARRESERLAEEQRKAAELEAQRDKLAEAVVELPDSEEEDPTEVDDIFVTDYIDAITSGEVQLGVVPDSPVLEFESGPDPFDTSYAETVIVGADKSKAGHKKLVALGAAVEVLSGRVEREKALELAKPKRKLRKGIKNLLLSESIDLADAGGEDLEAPEPQPNLLDELVDDVPSETDAPIDLSVSLHLNFIQPLPQTTIIGLGEPKKKLVTVEEYPPESKADEIDLSEFDTLKLANDDEFAELAAESLSKKDEVTILTELPIQKAAVLPEVVEGDWAQFQKDPSEGEEEKSERPAPPTRPSTGPHLVPGTIYISDDEEEPIDDDPFNTNYVEEVIKKTTVLEEDDDFDPRAAELEAEPIVVVESIQSGKPPPRPAKPPPPPRPPALLARPQRDLLGGSNSDLASKTALSPLRPKASEVDGDTLESEDYDPFDTSAVNSLVQPKEAELKCIERELLNKAGNLKHSLSDPDFDPRAEEFTGETLDRGHHPEVVTPLPQTLNNQNSLDLASRKSSLSLNLQTKSVGFLVPNQDLLGTVEGGGSNKKPLTPYYAPPDVAFVSEDPFDTSYVPDVKPTAIELKHLEKDLLSSQSNLDDQLVDQSFDPRAPPTPIPAEELLAVKENIPAKVLTPAQELRRDLVSGAEDTASFDPFDTSIAADIKPGEAELKLLENELLEDQSTPEVRVTVLDIQSDAQELGLGGKVLTPQLPRRQVEVPPEEEDIDPFDTSIADNLAPGETEIKLLESELIDK